MEFRTLREEELERWFDHCVYVFNEGIYDEYFRNRFVNHFYNDQTASLNRIFVAVENGEIASTVRIFKRDIFMENTMFSMGGIGEVSTKPFYRGRALATKLMNMAIDRMEEEKLQISLLGTGVHTFYEKLGWHPIIMNINLYRCNKETNFTYRIKEINFNNDWKEIKKIHSEYVRKLNCSINRDSEAYWEHWIKGENLQGWIVEDDKRDIMAYVFAEIKDEILVVKEYGEKNISVFDDTIIELCKLLKVEIVEVPACIPTTLEKIDSDTKTDWMIRLNRPIEIAGNEINSTYDLVKILNKQVDKLHFWEGDGF